MPITQTTSYSDATAGSRERYSTVTCRNSGGAQKSASGLPLVGVRLPCVNETAQVRSQGGGRGDSCGWPRP